MTNKTFSICGRKASLLQKGAVAAQPVMSRLPFHMRRVSLSVLEMAVDFLTVPMLGCPNSVDT